MAETADKRGEAKLNTYLGLKYCSQGEYGKGKEYLYKALEISKEIGDKQAEGLCYKHLGTVLTTLSEYDKAKEYLEKATEISKENGETQAEAAIFCSIGDHNNAKECYEKALLQEALSFETLGAEFQTRGEFGKAEEYFKKALVFRKEISDKEGEATDYANLGTVCRLRGDYNMAKKYYQTALGIRKEIFDKKGEAADYGNLGNLFCCTVDFGKAEEFYERVRRLERFNKEGEAEEFENLGSMFQSLGEYGKAQEYHEKGLDIRREIGDTKGEASSYENLGSVSRSCAEYVKAKKYHKKALAIRKEIGDRQGEASSYENLGSESRSCTAYANAEEYHKKALAIRKEIGDRQGEASSYENLGIVFQCPGGHGQAKGYHEKALAIRNEIGDRKGQASSYGNLGRLFQWLGEYFKAKKYFEKALAITKETGDRKGEAVGYGNLGEVFYSLSDYGKAKEYYEKALKIRQQIGDRQGEARDLQNLGSVFRSLGVKINAEEYYKKALQIATEIGDSEGEGRSYGNLGIIFSSHGMFTEAEEYFCKALMIRKENGDRKGEAEDLSNLGIALFHPLGKYVEAEQYLYAALGIRKEIGDREGEAEDYANLGTVSRSLGEYDKAKKHHHKAIELSKEIGNVEAELKWYENLTQDYLVEGNVEEAFCYLFTCLHKCENMRSLLTGNDRLKIFFLEEHVLQYRNLSKLLCDHGHYHSALYVLELGRARALADLMSARYDVKTHLSVNPKSWVGIERIILNKRECICLYYSYTDMWLNVYVLGGHKPICFRQAKVSDCVMKALNFGDVSFSLSRNDRQLARNVEDEEEAEHFDMNTLSLSEGYELFIAPVVDLLEKPEIVIVPDRSLSKVPFAALKDEHGKYLSEAFRIRIVPSLTTLKLIQDSPADYHSQTDALILGDPEVRDVMHMGRMERLCPLPGARREAEMIGRLLGVQPLLGKQATKQAILQSTQSVSLIHIAAHGDSRRGEIALAPLQPNAANPPVEEDYLLKMTDIAQVQLRAKLVVLSCCHSGCGQINREGTVGIARAFLGSGARSVLVALWAIPDEATATFMSRFYEHLVGGESASESLHHAQKWMRSNGFSDLVEWAPFTLIGDDVTFDSEMRKGGNVSGNTIKSAD